MQLQPQLQLPRPRSLGRKPGRSERSALDEFWHPNKQPAASTRPAGYGSRLSSPRGRRRRLNRDTCRQAAGDRGTRRAEGTTGQGLQEPRRGRPRTAPPAPGSAQGNGALTAAVLLRTALLYFRWNNNPHSYGVGEVGFLREFDSSFTSLWQKRHLRRFCLSLEN